MHRYRLPAVATSYPPESRQQPEEEGQSGLEEGEMVPYAHRDIKPAFVGSSKLGLIAGIS